MRFTKVRSIASECVAIIATDDGAGFVRQARIVMNVLSAERFAHLDVVVRAQDVCMPEIINYFNQTGSKLEQRSTPKQRNTWKFKSLL